MKKIFYSLLLVAATLGLASCEDVPAPFELMNNGSSTIVEPQGDGTLENPYNIAGINKVAKALATGETSAQAYYFKGKVVSFKAGEEPGNSYGNATFYISDDGTSAKQFYCYRVLGPDNKNFTSSDQLKEGDEVIMYGKVTNYNGTLETVQKEAYVYAINANGSEGGAPGTTDAIEATCAEAAIACNALADGATSTETYCVTGYITDVYTNISKGQQSFWMDDTKDGGKVLQAYWANLPEGVAAFTKGSKVKITGNLLKYVKDGNVTVEIKNANVEILEAGDNTPTPIPGEAKGDGTETSPYNVAATLAYTNNLAADTNSDPVYIKGYVVGTPSIDTGSYGNATFYIADEKGGNTTFYIFRCFDLKNQKFTNAQAIKEGDEVVIYGPVVNYKGNTPETVASKAFLISVNGKTEAEGGDNAGDNNDPTTGNEGDNSEGMTISNLPSDLTTNAYGTQAVSDESTWITWAWDNIQFAGARICKASAIEGTIQIQGNASEEAKQGFLFNKTAWASNIKKITLILKVKEGTNTYDPSYTLYAGSQAHPTTNAGTPTTNYTVSNGIRTYVEEYDLTRYNATYFTISNNKAGALYIEKICVE